MNKTIETPIVLDVMNYRKYYEIETAKGIYRAPWMNEVLLLWLDSKDGTKVLAYRKVENISLE